MSEPSWLRKAAILITSLDHETAKLVLESMDPATAARVASVAKNLRRVSKTERNAAFASYRAAVDSPVSSTFQPHDDARIGRGYSDGAQTSRDGAPEGSVNLACTTSTCNLDVGLAAQLGTSRSEMADGPDGLDGSEMFDGTVDSGAHYPEQAVLLAETLERERPQVIAAVLSRLPPSTAAKVLAGLCEDLQTEVLQRLACIATVDDEVHLALTRSIEMGVQHRRDQRRREAAGQAAVDAILAAGQDAQQVNTVPEPAKSASRPLQHVVFSDLSQLDDSSLLAVLTRSTMDVVQMAMLDAPSSMVTRVRRLAPDWIGGSDSRTPLLLDDIAKAQRLLASIASSLIDEGLIIFSTGRRLSAAA